MKNGETILNERYVIRVIREAIGNYERAHNAKPNKIILGDDLYSILKNYNDYLIKGEVGEVSSIFGIAIQIDILNPLALELGYMQRVTI